MSALATVDQLAAYLGIEIDTADDIARAEQLLDFASGAIRAYTSQTLTEVEDDEVTLDGNGATVLLLPEVPVTEVTEVVIAGTTLDPDAYTVSTRGILGRSDGEVFTDGYGNIEVTYTHGYATLPADLVMVCCQAAGRGWSTAAGSGIVQETIGRHSVTYVRESLDPQTGELAILDRYKP